jgi:ABC-type phosphate transport system substrate-binding protein
MNVQLRAKGVDRDRRSLGHRSRARGSWLAAVALAAVMTWSGNPGPSAQTSGRLAVIANPAVPVKSLSGAELAAIYSRTTRNWKDGSAIRPLNLQPGSPERVAFDRAVLHLDPDQSAQFWVDKMVRGEEGAPKAIAKAEIILRLVPTLAGAIAYVPEDKVEDKVRVLAFIRDGKVVAP